MILNLINGKLYIGQSGSKNRWAEHLYASKNPEYEKHMYIHRAINKYGENNFDFNIIEKDIR